MQPATTLSPSTASVVQPRRLQAALVVGAASVALGLLLTPLQADLRILGALVLFVVLPGHLLVQAVFKERGPKALERGLLALGCGYVLAATLTLILHALFRPLFTPHLLAGAVVLNLGLLALALARRADLRPQLGRLSWQPILVLLVAASLRLYNLGWSEFQGDEAEVVLRAAAVLQGMPDALLAHRKPPGEVLLAATFTGALGTVTEWSGRLPFALAGVAGVLALYCLGRALFGVRAGLVAGLLLAVCGYFVAFGRILQYESVRLLLDTLAILCLWRFARGSLQSNYAVAGGLLAAGCALTATSAVFLIPVASLALLGPLFGARPAPRRSIAVWFWPLVVLVPAAVLVYLVLSPGSGSQAGPPSPNSYFTFRLGDDAPYFNWRRLLQSGSDYTSSLYLLVMLGAGGLVVLRALYACWRDVAPRLVPATSCLAIGLAWFALEVDRLLPALLVAGVVLVLVSSKRQSLGWKLALVWFAAPLFVHLFLVRIPLAHWREIFPGLSLAIAPGAVGLYERMSSRRIGSPDGLEWRSLAALVAGGLFLAATVHYVYVVWLQPWPEYRAMFPAQRHPLDWSGQDSPNTGSTYGMVRLHGWKAVGVLVAEGVLPASYNSNENKPAMAWYLKRPHACGDAIQLYVRAPRTLRDVQANARGESMNGYSVAGQVQVEGRPGLMLLTRERSSSPRVYQAEAYVEQFDREFASPWAPIGNLYRPYVNIPSCP